MTTDKRFGDHKHTSSDVEEIDCLEAIELLYAYLDSELNEGDLAKFEHHLEHCKSCYSRSELETTLIKRIKTSVKDEAPDSLQHRLRDLIDKL